MPGGSGAHEGRRAGGREPHDETRRRISAAAGGGGGARQPALAAWHGAEPPLPPHAAARTSGSPRHTVSARGAAAAAAGRAGTGGAAAAPHRGSGARGAGLCPGRLQPAGEGGRGRPRPGPAAAWCPGSRVCSAGAALPGFRGEPGGKGSPQPAQRGRSGLFPSWGLLSAAPRHPAGLEAPSDGANFLLSSVIKAALRGISPSLASSPDISPG